jgi:integrase
MGQIIARGPRKWLVREFVRSEPVVDAKTGKKKRKKIYTAKTVTGTFATAQTALAALRTDISQGTFIPPSVQTLRQFVEWWLSEVVSQKCEGATQRSYKDRIEPYLAEVGYLKLDKVTAPVLQKAINKLSSDRSWARRTTRYTKTILSMALNEAVRQGLLKSNPASALILPKENPVEEAEVKAEGATELSFRVWTQEQIQAFLDRIAGSPWYPLWHLLLNTGMRPGEAAGLQWSDLSGNSIVIFRAVKSDGKGGWLIGPPKTKKSRRVISLPESTLRVLRQHRRGQLGGFMFSPASLGARDHGGGFLTVPQMHVMWLRDLKRAQPGDPELPSITLYETRHTHLTLLLSLGVPVKVVSERAGHTGVEITLNTYTHVLPHMQAAVAEQLDRAFITR